MFSFRLLIPFAVIAWLVYKSRSKPVYFTLIPWVVGIGRGLFLELTPATVLFQGGNYAITVQDLLFGLVLMVWVYSYRGRKIKSRFFSHPGSWIVSLWIMFLFWEFLVNIMDPSMQLKPGLVIDARTWFYFPFSLMLWVDTYQRYSREEFLEALGVLSLLVAGCSLLFILDIVAGVDIYPNTGFYDQAGGVALYRDYINIASFWLGLVFLYFLLVPRSRLIYIGGLAIIALANILTYTRSRLIMLVSVVALAAIFLLAKNLLVAIYKKNGFPAADFQRAHPPAGKARIIPRSNLVVFLLGGLPALGLLALAVFPMILPAQWSFVLARFGQSMLPTETDSQTSLSVRWLYFMNAWRDGAVYNEWFGNGLILHNARTGWWSFDSDWIHIVYHFGVAGVIVFALPLLWAAWKSMSAFFAQRDPVAERLALLLLLLNITGIISRFTGIVYLWWFPLSTLPIALTIIESGRLWRSARETVAVSPRLAPNASAVPGQGHD